MVGLLAVEMFVTKTGKVLVNEVAPRPHNSGHQTIEANITSQYEQHLFSIGWVQCWRIRGVIPWGGASSRYAAWGAGWGPERRHPTRQQRRSYEVSATRSRRMSKRHRQIA